MKFLNKKGNAQIFDVVIGLILIAIGIFAVAYPIVVGAIASLVNLSATDTLIVKYVGTMVLLVGFISIVGYMYMRRSE